MVPREDQLPLGLSRIGRATKCEVPRAPDAAYTMQSFQSFAAAAPAAGFVRLRSAAPQLKEWPFECRAAKICVRTAGRGRSRLPART